MITAVTIDKKIILTVSDDSEKRYRLERKLYGTDDWLAFCGDGFYSVPTPEPKTDEVPADDDTEIDGTETDNKENDSIADGEQTDENATENTDENSETEILNGETDTDENATENNTESDGTDENADDDTDDNVDNESDGEEIEEETHEVVFISAGDFLDNFDLQEAVYAYRYIEENAESYEKDDYKYSNWVRISLNRMGYTFGNYEVPEGKWGTVITEDDMRYTYLWGVDFKAANGESFSDEQIRFFIDNAVKTIERLMDITIVKKQIRYNAKERELIKGEEYDEEEALYDFKFSRISRYGMIKLRQRPVIKLHSLKLLSRYAQTQELTEKTVCDKTKGLLKLMQRPLRQSATRDGIGTAIGVYGKETLQNHLFYAIDYDAGYETSDDVPFDLREIIGKQAAVSLLNVIGDGLLSRMSSGSLSMDGLSESFSATQSGNTGAFGARISQYKEDISNYIKETKNKFATRAIGTL